MDPNTHNSLRQIMNVVHRGVAATVKLISEARLNDDSATLQSGQPS